MTLFDLYSVCPQSHIFIRHSDGSVEEYTGGRKYAYWYAIRVTATSYPMYKSVIEVVIRNH